MIEELAARDDSFAAAAAVTASGGADELAGCLSPTVLRPGGEAAAAEGADSSVFWQPRPI